MTKTTAERAREQLVWNKEIRCWTFNRARHESCVWASDYCRQHCYNRNIESRRESVRNADRDLETSWQWYDGERVRTILDRKRTRQTDRVRLMSRGEAFATLEDVFKVKEIAEQNPGRMFWIPTRAWRAKGTLMCLAISLLQKMDNVRVLASTDPTTTKEEYAVLVAGGWSTMFFGDNNTGRVQAYYGIELVRCPKTFDKTSGVHCDTCTGGCWSDGQIHVHLKRH